MKSYHFATQLSRGRRYEEQLDAFFAQRLPVEIQPATDAEQRQGIDRWFMARTSAGDGRPRGRDAVEYKADTVAGRTGNAFIETVSVDRGPDSPPKPGWAMTSQARYLVYLVAGQEEAIYLIPFRRLRLCLPRWGREYPTGAAPNEGYTTKGLLVPLHELERIAIAVW